MIDLTSDAGTYRRFLADLDLLDRGFRFGEIVDPRTYRKTHPPEDLWPNMPPTLALGHALRTVMVEEHGARGLLVRASYRPKGSRVKDSAHPKNRALDLDLLHRDYQLASVYYEEAVKLWVAVGAELDVGLGLYCRAGNTSGIRVHFDTHHRSYPRTWQCSGRSFVNGTGRAALRICRRLGLDPPSRDAL